MKNKYLDKVISKCCKAKILTYYNARRPGHEEEFFCDKCDKELKMDNDYIKTPTKKEEKWIEEFKKEVRRQIFGLGFYGPDIYTFIIKTREEAYLDGYKQGREDEKTLVEETIDLNNLQ